MSFIAAAVVKLTCPDTRTGNLDKSGRRCPFPFAPPVGDGGVGSGGGGSGHDGWMVGVGHRAYYRGYVWFFLLCVRRIPTE